MTMNAKGRLSVRPLQAERAPAEIHELAQTLEEMAESISVRDGSLQGGPRYDIEYRAVRPDGEVRFVRSQGDVRTKAAQAEFRGTAAARGVVVWNDADKVELEAAVKGAMASIAASSPRWWAWALLIAPPVGMGVAVDATASCARGLAGRDQLRERSLERADERCRSVRQKRVDLMPQWSASSLSEVQGLNRAGVPSSGRRRRREEPDTPG